VVGCDVPQSLTGAPACTGPWLGTGLTVCTSESHHCCCLLQPHTCAAPPALPAMHHRYPNYYTLHTLLPLLMMLVSPHCCRCVHTLPPLQGLISRTLEVHPQAITPEFLAAHMPGLAAAGAAQQLAALFKAQGLLDGQGLLLHDPRGSAWRRVVTSSSIPGACACAAEACSAGMCCAWLGAICLQELCLRFAACSGLPTSAILHHIHMCM
jgi:hypothetical protein